MSEVSLVNGHIDEPKKETNYDRIKAMSIEQMAEVMYSAADKICFENCMKETGNEFCCKHDEDSRPEQCINCMKRWLESATVAEKCCENCTHYNTDLADQPCCSCVNACNYEESEVDTE